MNRERDTEPATVVEAVAKSAHNAIYLPSAAGLMFTHNSSFATRELILRGFELVRER